MPFSFTLLLFIQIVTSASISNTWSRISSPSSTSYTVYPSDLSNQTQLHNTEVLLGNLFPGSTIQLDYDHSINLAWCITSDQDHLQETLIALEGVRNVELGFRRDEAEATLTARSQLFRRDLKYYAIAAKPGSDVQATKEFLKTKVQDNQEIYDYLDDQGTIVGWGHLAIDNSVVQEVENYEGVQAPLMREDDDDLRAISTNEIHEL